MLALGLQTDISGVPWLVYLLWPLAGWLVSHPGSGEQPPAPRARARLLARG
jgi:hypothetical protein